MRPVHVYHPRGNFGTMMTSAHVTLDSSEEGTMDESNTPRSPRDPLHPEFGSQFRERSSSFSRLFDGGSQLSLPSPTFFSHDFAGDFTVQRRPGTPEEHLWLNGANLGFSSSLNVDQQNPDAEKTDKSQSNASGSGDNNAITYKRSCKMCTSRRVKCSGPPGPCRTCSKRGYGKEMCVFLPRRKPGPKKRDYDLLVAINSNDSIVYPSMPDFQQSLCTNQIVTQLRLRGFLLPNWDAASPFLNESFARTCIATALQLCGTQFDSVLQVTLTCSNFTRLMISYQQHSGEDHGLSRNDCERLFWCVTSFDASDNQKAMQWMSIVDLSLSFMWLGVLPSSNQNKEWDLREPAWSASRAVNMIYEWVHQSTKRLDEYQGMCSKQEVERVLQSGSQSTVLYLMEGRLDSMRSDNGAFVSCPSRNLGRASLSNEPFHSNWVHETLLRDHPSLQVHITEDDLEAIWLT